MFASSTYHTVLQRVRNHSHHSHFKSAVVSSEYISGVVFACAACPDIPLPNEWLPLLFRHPPERTSASQVDEFCDHVMALFKCQLLDIQNAEAGLPDSCILASEEDGVSPLSEWCKGFLAAHQSNEPKWQRGWELYVATNCDDEPERKRALIRCLKLLSTFADLSFALAQRSADDKHKLLNNLDGLYQSINSCLLDYLLIADELTKVLPENIELTQRTDERKSNDTGSH